MRIGLVVGLHGDAQDAAPAWPNIRDQVVAAEAVGFDVVVIEDALLYRDEDATIGYWESVSMAGAIAAATSTIELGHSVFNAPYRTAALTAKIAETLDEISGGRYILGIGAGNVPDHDYAAFGFPADKRYSRFAETIEIIHGLLKEGRVDFEGEYQSARDAEMVLRSRRPQGPPIVIAAGGPKMLRLAARFGDGWNWWATSRPDAGEDLRPLIDEMERACDEVGRDPATLAYSLDYYSVDPSRSGEANAERLLAFRDLGFEEIRVNLTAPETTEGHSRAIEAMAPVVELVHAG